MSERVWMHWSNENRDNDGWWASRPWNARVWLHFWRRVACLQWVLGRFKFGLHVNANESEHEWTFGVQVPGLSLWLSVSGLGSRRFWKWLMRAGGHERDLSLRVFDAAIWWNLWVDDTGRGPRPGWRAGNFRPIDVLLGKANYTNEVLSTHHVLIPMPEGGYPAVVTMERATWKRPRWFAKHVRRADIQIDVGIPHAGKGENAWDCGRDATFGLGCVADTIEEAVAKTVQCVLRSRRKYDGDVMADYPPAADRIAAVTAAREARISQ